VHERVEDACALQATREVSFDGQTSSFMMVLEAFQCPLHGS